MMRAPTYVLLLATAVCAAFADELANPARSGEWVVDTAGVFDAAERARIAALLRRIHKSTGVQFVVAAVPAQKSPRAYAIELFDRWALGSAERNDGVLLLLTREERAAEVVVGRGLTGVLPNEELRTILSGRPAPVEMVKQIGARLAGIERKPAGADPAWMWWAAAGLLFGAVGFAGWMSAYRFSRAAPALPATGRRRETRIYTLPKSEFVTRKGLQFFAHQAEAIDPRFRDFRPAPLWAAVVGLAGFAAAVAGAALTLARFDLEPSVWLTGAAVLASSIVTLVAMERIDDEASPAGRFGIPLLALIFTFGITNLFLSDRMLAWVAAPGSVLAVNLAAGALLARALLREGRSPKSYYCCATCGGALQEVAQEEMGPYLEGWEIRARQVGLAYFRGWRCAACHPKPGPEAGYVVHGAAHDGVLCAKCGTPTVESARRSGGRIEKKCIQCGQTRIEQAPKQDARAGSTVGAASASGGSGIAGADDGGDPSDWRSYDSTDSSTSGGGTTDGEGASGNW